MPRCSIARARVAAGVTTRWHALDGIVERYVILEGRARAEVGDVVADVGPGDVVLIPPQCRQRIANTGRGDLVFLAICTPRFRPEAYVDDRFTGIVMNLVTGATSAWLVLLVAGILEVVWAIGLKYSDGFTKLAPSIVTAIAAALSFWLLALSLRVLPVGTAYAAWTGIGAVGAAILGMMLFNEPATAARIACIVLILAGIAGLKLLAD